MTNGIRAIRIVSGLLATIALGGVMLLLFALIPPGSVYGAPLEKALSQSTPTAPTVLAVVRNQGAVLYTRPGNEPIQTLVGGSLVSALLRSQNELWVLVETRGLVQGWVEVQLLLAAGLNRLPVEQPTPEPTSTPDAEAIEAATSEPSDGATPDAQPTGTPETEAEADMASSTPELMPEATAELMPEATPELMPEATAELTAEAMTEPTAEAMTEATAETMTEATAETMTEPTAEAMTEATAETMTEPTAEAAPTDAMAEPVTPEPTPMPFVPPDGPAALALVRIEGADVWRIEDDSLAAHFEPGKRLTAANRTPESDWYFVYDDNGIHGWAMAADLVVVDGSSLPVEDITISVGTTEMATATPTATVVPEKVVITVNSFGQRLNVRAGPSTEFEIVAKAVTGVTFNGIGRNEAGDWILIAIADLPSGSGWVSASFVTSDRPLDELPVVEETMSVVEK